MTLSMSASMIVCLHVPRYIVMPPAPSLAPTLWFEEFIIPPLLPPLLLMRATGSSTGAVCEVTERDELWKVGENGSSAHRAGADGGADRVDRVDRG
jgi:hypothetical protein